MRFTNIFMLFNVVQYSFLISSYAYFQTVSCKRDIETKH